MSKVAPADVEPISPETKSNQQSSVFKRMISFAEKKVNAVSTVDQLLADQLSRDEASKISKLKPSSRSRFLGLDSNVERNKAARIAELLVTKQQKEHLNPKSIFNTIYYNRQHILKKVLTEQPDFIKDTDAVGGSPVHVAYLYQKYDVGRWLVEHFPDEALQPYTDKSTYVGLPPQYMPYTGENILHMTIIRRNHVEARFLLDFYRDRKDSVPNCRKRKKALLEREMAMKNNSTSERSGERSTLIGQMADKVKDAVEDLVEDVADVVGDIKDAAVDMLGKPSRRGSSIESRVNDSLVDYTQNGLHILLFAHAQGTFFSRDGNFYCGQTPLQFAVCSNDTDMFDMILSYATGEDPNAIFTRDMYGNTLLHLCILHDLKEMYEHVQNHCCTIIRKQISFVCGQASIKKIPPVMEPIVMEKGYTPRETPLTPPKSQSQFIEWLKVATLRKFSERMSLVLNEDLHSPLTLAASSGNYNMLEFLISMLKVPRWTYGPVAVSLVELDGLEMAHNTLNYGPLPKYNKETNTVEIPAIDPNVPCCSRPIPPNAKLYGAIEWLCINPDSTFKAFEIDFIKHIINKKWERSAQAVFYRSAVIVFIITFLMTVISCLIGFVPTRENGHLGSKVLAVFYPITAIFLAILTLAELPAVLVHGLDYWGVYGGIRGAAVYEKYCMTAVILSFCALCIFESIKILDKNKDGENSRVYIEGDDAPHPYLSDLPIEISLVVCVVSVWNYLFYIFMGFDSTGPFVLKIFRIIRTEVPDFLQYFCIVIAAFAAAVSIISNTQEEHPHWFWSGFYRLVQTVWAFVKLTVGAETGIWITNETIPADLWWLFDILMTLYWFIAALLFLNLLIAIMGNGFDNYDSITESLLLLEKYNIMCSMERVMSETQKRKVLESYAIGEEIDTEGNTAVTSKDILEHAESNPVRGKAINSGDDSDSGSDDEEFNLEDSDLVHNFVHAGKEKITNAIEKVEKFAGVVAGLKKSTSNSFQALKTNNNHGGGHGSSVSHGHSIKITQKSDRSESSVTLTRWNFKWEVTDHGWFTEKVDNSYKYSDSSMKIILLIVDPQNDFHDHDRLPAPALPVKGAMEDARRIGKMIRENIHHFDEIYVTMDSHHVRKLTCFLELYLISVWNCLILVHLSVFSSRNCILRTEVSGKIRMVNILALLLLLHMMMF